MGSADDTADMGGANLKVIQKTVESDYGDYPDPELRPSARFVTTAIKTIRTRRDHPDSYKDPQQIAVFLQCEEPRWQADPVNAEKVPLFRNGSAQLGGRIWLTPLEMTVGWKLDFSHKEAGKVFSYIEEDLKLGAVPTVVFDPTATVPEVRFYPEGVAHAAQCESFEVIDSEFSADILEKALDQFYLKHLRTPQTSNIINVWSEPAKFVPCERTESLIQGFLTIFLSGKLDNCRFKTEETTPEGRADIFIHASNKEGQPYLAVLELKVLRSLSSSGKTSVTQRETLKHVQDGLGQAIAYRNERSVPLALLCCYDMRKVDDKDKCLDHIRVQAGREKITLKRWYLFNSASNLRKAKYGA